MEHEECTQFDGRSLSKHCGCEIRRLVTPSAESVCPRAQPLHARRLRGASASSDSQASSSEPVMGGAPAMMTTCHM